MSTRNKKLGLIHIGKQKLGIADDDYRDMLEQVAGVRSAAKLDAGGLDAVIKHLRSLGFEVTRKQKPIPTENRPHNFKQQPQLHKIGRLLAEQDLTWNYANGIVQQMFGIDDITFCKPRQLSAVIAALDKHQRRQSND